MKKFKIKKSTKFLLEQKAQSGPVFRLMIDSIIGLAILAMILSALSYFNYLKVQSSFEEFNNKVISAINSPNGQVIESNGALFFLEGTGFTSVGLEELTAYPAECFSFESNLSVIEISPINQGSAKMLGNIETRVYFRCNSTGQIFDYETGTGCDIECVISFGRKLEDLSSFN